MGLGSVRRRSALFAVSLLLSVLVPSAPVSSAPGGPPPLAWVHAIGSTGAESALDVAVDEAGNVITVGRFVGTVDFDPGPGSSELTSPGVVSGFIVKTSADGTFEWAAKVGDAAYGTVFGVDVDDSGDVYATGYFTGTTDFDPGPGTADLTSGGGFDAFVLHLAADGSFEWAAVLGGVDPAQGEAVAVDALGNVVVTGSFEGTADFDPAGGATFELTSAGATDAFVARLASDGSFVGAGAMGGTGQDWGLGVDVDGAGNVFTAGFFTGTADFDPAAGTSSELTAAGGTDAFVTRLESDGSFGWAAAAGDTGFDQANDVAVDADGCVFVGGYFLGTADFDPDPVGSIELTASSTDGFVWMLEGDGSAGWAGRLGGTGFDEVLGVAVDGADNVYAAGDFFITMDADPGAGSHELTANGMGTDAFVVALGGDGSFRWAAPFGGTNLDVALDLAAAAADDVTVVGSFRETADADPGAGVLEVTSAGLDDAFVWRLADLIDPMVTLTAPGDGVSFPQGSVVSADFSCADEVGGSGLASCVGTVADGAAIDTATVGAKSFTVTGTDVAGNTTVVTHTYTVTDVIDPMVTLTTPGDGASIARGSVVAAEFACSDEAGGSGVDSCVGTVADGAAIDTASLGAKSFTVTGTDVAGNTTVVTHTYTVTDATDPAVTLTTPGDGASIARGSVVAADFACSDEVGGSGVDSCVGTVADGAAIDTASLGAKSFTVTGADVAGNTTVVTHTYTVIDATDPAVSIVTPVEGSEVRLRAAVLADFSCSDEAGGSGLASCVGTVADGGGIDTASPGAKSFTVTGTDIAGNTTVVTHTYTVVRPLPTVGLVDPTQGRWHLRNAAGVETSFFYGNPDDFPLMGDWDCDGIDTPGMYRQSDGFVYVRNSNSQGVADSQFFLGNPGDVPLAGDWNGNGCDTVSIYRPSEQRFYIANELAANNAGIVADFDFLFGNPGDKPVTGDWDGDGITEIGLHRESSGFFYWRDTLDTGVASDAIFFGDPGDRFVAGDWGVVDGRDTPAVFRPAGTTFFFRHTLTQGIADAELDFGEANWLPVAGVFGLD